MEHNTESGATQPGGLEEGKKVGSMTPGAKKKRSLSMHAEDKQELQIHLACERDSRQNGLSWESAAAEPNENMAELQSRQHQAHSSSVLRYIAESNNAHRNFMGKVLDGLLQQSSDLMENASNLMEYASNLSSNLMELVRSSEATDERYQRQLVGLLESENAPTVVSYDGELDATGDAGKAHQDEATQNNIVGSNERHHQRVIGDAQNDVWNMYEGELDAIDRESERFMRLSSQTLSALLETHKDAAERFMRFSSQTLSALLAAQKDAEEQFMRLSSQTLSALLETHKDGQAARRHAADRASSNPMEILRYNILESHERTRENVLEGLLQVHQKEMDAVDRAQQRQAAMMNQVAQSSARTSSNIMEVFRSSKAAQEKCARKLLPLVSGNPLASSTQQYQTNETAGAAPQMSLEAHAKPSKVARALETTASTENDSTGGANFPTADVAQRAAPRGQSYEMKKAAAPTQGVIRKMQSLGGGPQAIERVIGGKRQRTAPETEHPSKISKVEGFSRSACIDLFWEDSEAEDDVVTPPTPVAVPTRRIFKAVRPSSTGMSHMLRRKRGIMDGMKQFKNEYMYGDVQSIILSCDAESRYDHSIEKLKLFIPTQEDREMLNEAANSKLNLSNELILLRNLSEHDMLSERIQLIQYMQDNGKSLDKQRSSIQSISDSIDRLLHHEEEWLRVFGFLKRGLSKKGLTLGCEALVGLKDVPFKDATMLKVLVRGLSLHDPLGLATIVEQAAGLSKAASVDLTSLSGRVADLKPLREIWAKLLYCMKENGQYPTEHVEIFINATSQKIKDLVEKHELMLSLVQDLNEFVKEEGVCVSDILAAFATFAADLSAEAATLDHS